MICRGPTGAGAAQHPKVGANSLRENPYPHPGDRRIAIAKTSVTALKLMSPAYAYAAKLLKFLQWIKPAKRWVLKTPHHLEFPDLIEKHFGNVHFLWPHRTIYESAPSFLSMVTYNHMIFSNNVDEKRIAHHWVRKTGYMLEKALNYRKNGANDGRFIDIDYRELVRDSIPMLSKIYSLNGGLNEALIARFKEHEEENPHRKHGAHHYSPADFGLTETDIDRYTFKYQQFIKEHNGG